MRARHNTSPPRLNHVEREIDVDPGVWVHVLFQEVEGVAISRKKGLCGFDEGGVGDVVFDQGRSLYL